MGLFDLFKAKKEEFTPIKMCVISMLYIANIDNEISPEEIGHLLSIVGGKNNNKTIQVGGQSKGFIEDCLEYVNNNNVNVFLKFAADKLTHAQKLYIVTNMLDSSLSDGTADKNEESLIEQFMEAFGISIDEVSPIIQVLELKNDRNIFADQKYEKNNSNFKFEIKL